MLLPTMTYEEIYQAICKDMPDLFDVITADAFKFQQKAKRAPRYPYRRLYDWKHPNSNNVYFYFFEVKRHSDWDKRVRIVVFTEFDDKEGKTTIAISKQQNRRVDITIIGPHFFNRYLERSLSKVLSDPIEHALDVKIAFLLRTSSTISLGDKIVSPKEKEKDEPNMINDSMLTTEGLIFVKRLKSNPNIVLFKTFLTVQQLFEPQYAAVTMNLIHVFYKRAVNDSPRYKNGIDGIYLTGIEELNRLWDDKSLPFDKKQELRMQKYNDILDALDEYIIQ